MARLATPQSAGFFGPATPDILQQQRQLERNKQLADYLQQQALKDSPTEFAGGIAVKQSPFQGLARLMDAYGSRKLDEQNDSLANKIAAQSYNQQAGMFGMPQVPVDQTQPSPGLFDKLSNLVGGKTDEQKVDDFVSQNPLPTPQSGPVDNSMVIPGMDPRMAFMMYQQDPAGYAKALMESKHTKLEATKDANGNPILYNPYTGEPKKIEGVSNMPKAPDDYFYDQNNQLKVIPGSKAANGLGAAAESAQAGLSNIDWMLAPENNDTMRRMVGPVSHYKPTLSNSGADFQTRLNQLQGGAFLQAYNTLRGGGQITEVEGKKATEAMNRMSTANSEQGFIEAAKEYRAILQKGIERAKAQGINIEVPGNQGNHANEMPQGLPQGATKIGTSGGKAVYKLPNGQHVMEQ